jgi:hypothetical protein
MHSEWPLSGKPEVWSVPTTVGGNNRMLPFAANLQIGKAAIRYASEILLS